MSLVIFSVLGVVFAFLGLGVFLLALISLLPVNIYIAIMSSIKLSCAIPLADKSIIPTLIFGGNILIALISAALFYMITRKQKEAKDIMNGKTDNNRRGTTASNQISNHNVFSHHKHSIMNVYTYSYVIIDVIWALVGSYLLYILISNTEDDTMMGKEEKQLMMLIEVIRSHLSTLWLNIMILAISACSMGFASLFFILGKKKSHPETKPLLFSRNV